MPHGDASEGNGRGELANAVGSQYSCTVPQNMVYPALLPLMCTPRLPAVDWSYVTPRDLNGLVRLAERRMQWVASTLHTTSEHGVSSITTADAHTSAASSRLNWRHTARFKWTRRCAERRNLVSALVPSHFKRSLTQKGRKFSKSLQQSPVEMWWQTETRGRGSEGETVE